MDLTVLKDPTVMREFSDFCFLKKGIMVNSFSEIRLYPDGQAIHALFYFFEQEVLPKISKKAKRDILGAIRCSLSNCLLSKNHTTTDTFFSDFLYSTPMYFDILNKFELHCTQNNIPYFSGNPLVGILNLESRYPGIEYKQIFYTRRTKPNKRTKYYPQRNFDLNAKKYNLIPSLYHPFVWHCIRELNFEELQVFCGSSMEKTLLSKE